MESPLKKSQANKLLEWSWYVDPIDKGGSLVVGGSHFFLCVPSQFWPKELVNVRCTRSPRGPSGEWVLNGEVPPWDRAIPVRLGSSLTKLEELHSRLLGEHSVLRVGATEKEPNGRDSVSIRRPLCSDSLQEVCFINAFYAEFLTELGLSFYAQKKQKMFGTSALFLGNGGFVAGVIMPMRSSMPLELFEGKIHG